MSELPPTPGKKDEPEPITVVNQSGLVTAIVIPRTLEMYTVTDQELDALASGPQSIHLTFLGIMIGAVVVIVVTLLTIHLETTVAGLFVVALLVTLTGSAYFGIRAVMDLRTSGNRLNSIRSNRRLRP